MATEETDFERSDEGRSPRMRGPLLRHWPLIAAVMVSTVGGAIAIEVLTHRQHRGGNPAVVARAKASANRISLPRDDPSEMVAEAVRLAESLLASFSQDPDALILAGQIFRSFADTPKAVECLQLATTIRRESPEAFFQLGLALRDSGDHVRAAESLAKAHALDPANADLATALGESLLACGKPQDAITVLSGGEKGARDPAQRLATRGQACLQLGQFDQARADFEAAIAREPRQTNAHYGLATVLARLGDAKQAAQHRQIFVKLKQQEREREKRGRPGQKELELDQVRRLLAGFALDAGRIYAARGRQNLSQEFFLRSVELEPHAPSYRQLLDTTR